MIHLTNSRFDLLKASSVRRILLYIRTYMKSHNFESEGGYYAMKLPLIVLACKSDLKRQVEPERALEIFQPYDAGLVEVSKTLEQGKDKMRRTFAWILKAVVRDKRWCLWLSIPVDCLSLFQGPIEAISPPAIAIQPLPTS